MQIVRDFTHKVIEDFGTVEVVANPREHAYVIGTKGRGLSYMFHYLDNALETARRIEEEAAEGIYRTEEKLRSWEYNDNPYRASVYTVTLDLVGYDTSDSTRATTLTNIFSDRPATIGIEHRLKIRTGTFSNDLFIDKRGETGDVFATVEDAVRFAEGLMGLPLFHRAIEEYEERLYSSFPGGNTTAWEAFGVFKVWEVRENGRWQAQGVDYAEGPVWTGEAFNRSTQGVTDLWAAAMGGIQQQ